MIGKLSCDTINPVVGLDVSKGESQVQAFLGKGQPYGKALAFRDGLDTFLHFLKNVESITSQQRPVVLEFNRTLSSPITQCLEEQKSLVHCYKPTHHLSSEIIKLTQGQN